MSNLYMTTEEFAALVVDALHEQNYFKKGSKNHPGDIVIAFTSTAESIAAAMEWAISKEHEFKKKQAMMETTTLAKNYSGNAAYHRNTVLPMDEEIAPSLLQDGEPLVNDEAIGYSEWIKSKGIY